MRPVFGQRRRAHAPEDGRNLPPVGDRAATPVLLRDPVRLHRILDRLLAPRDGPPDALNAVAKSAVEVFDPLRSELGLEAFAVYVEDGDVLKLQQQVGGSDGQFAASVRITEADHLLRPRRRARVFADPEAADAPTRLGLAPRGPTAVRVVEAASGRHLLVAALNPATEAAAAEFVLGVVGTIVAAHALRERWRQSLDEAEEIQRELLPTNLPVLPEFEIAARSVPAEVVGGDFYDFVDLGGGATGIAVGDAVGHGLSAALVARDVVVGLRVALDRRRPAAGVLARLNRVLRAGLPGRAFASLFYVELHPDGRIEYVSAGHPPALCVMSGSHTALRRGGPVLGPFEQVSYRRTRSRLRAGEILVLYTDGIVERRDAQGEHFSEDRLAALVAAHASEPVQDILDRVFAQATEFGQGASWSDDATLVLVRRSSNSSEPGAGEGRSRRRTAAASGRSQEAPPAAGAQPRR